MIFILLGFILNLSNAHAESGLARMDEKTDLSEVETIDPVRLGIFAEYSLVNFSGGIFSSSTVGGNVRYGLSDRFGIGGALRQSFAIATINQFFSSLNLEATYALSGSLRGRSEDVSLGTLKVARIKGMNRGGFRLTAFTGATLLRGTSTLVPLTGIGGYLSYEFATRTSLGYFIGSGAESLSNTKTRVIISRLFFGITF